MRYIAALVCSVVFALSAIADDYIVIVFDTSGSMGDIMRGAGKSRMVVAQDALIDVLSKVPDSTQVGVLTFNGWIYDISKVDRPKLATAIRNCKPGGGTPLYRHIKNGATRLLVERQKQNNLGYYKLLVVTDGEASDSDLNKDGIFKDGTVKLSIMNDIIGRGVIVDTIGLDMKGDHTLSKEINGTYMKGDDPASLQKSLNKAVAEVGFKGDDKFSEEIFKELSDLPDSFAKATIDGLTTFHNHPIGELPPIRVVMEDGSVVDHPNPNNSEGVAPSSGLRWYWWVLIVLGGGLVVLFIIAARNH